MSQLAMELSHINRTRKGLEDAFSKHEMTRGEYLDYDLKYLCQSSNRIGQMVSLIVSAAKHGVKVKNMAEKHNLIGYNEAINTGNPEIEMIKCPDKDQQLITRAECLDYSGGEKNAASCGSCDNFSVNRRLLLS